MHLQRRCWKSSDLLVCESVSTLIEKGSATTDENENMDEKNYLSSVVGSLMYFMVLMNKTEVQKIITLNQPADIFTKAIISSIVYYPKKASIENANLSNLCPKEGIERCERTLNYRLLYVLD